MRELIIKSKSSKGRRRLVGVLLAAAMVTGGGLLGYSSYNANAEVIYEKDAVNNLSINLTPTSPVKVNSINDAAELAAKPAETVKGVVSPTANGSLLCSVDKKNLSSYRVFIEGTGLESVATDPALSGNLFGSFPTLSLDTTAIADGNYKLVYEAINKCDDKVTAKVDIIVDNTAPTFNILDINRSQPIASGSVINADKPVYDKLFLNKVAADTLVKVECADGSVDNTSRWTGTAQPQIRTGVSAWGLCGNFAADGPYKFYVSDPVGNVSKPYEIIVDRVKPVIENISIAKALTNENSIAVSGTVTDVNLSSYKCRIYSADKSTNLSNDLIKEYPGGTVSVTNGKLCTMNIGPLSDGDYLVRVYADDKAGNNNNDGQLYFPFTIDRTAPTLEIVNMLNGQLWNKVDLNGKIINPDSLPNKDFRVLTNDDGTLKITGPSGFETTLSISQSANNQNILWALNQGGQIVDGEYTFVKIDAAGNESTPVTITIDTTAPEITKASFGKADTTTLKKAGEGVMFYFNASEELAEWPTLKLGGKSVEVKSGTSYGYQYVAYLYTSSSTPEGPLSIELSYTDLAGNSGQTVTATTDGSQVIVDTTAPTITQASFNNKHNGEIVYKKDGGVMFYFNASEELTEWPTLKLGGQTVKVGSGANYGYDYSAYLYLSPSIPEGYLSIELNFKDLVGNVGTVMVATVDGSDVVVDRTPPEIMANPAVEDNGNTLKVNSSISDTWSFVAETSCEIYTDSSLTDKVDLDFKCDEAADISQLVNGVYYLKVWAKDAANNETYQSYEITIDRQYKVFFQLGDGSLGVTEVVVTEGGLVAKPADPTRDNYIFGGWIDKAEQVWDFSQPIYNNLVLTAKWTAVVASSAGSGGGGEYSPQVATTTSTGLATWRFWLGDDDGDTDTTESVATTTPSNTVKDQINGEVLGAQDSQSWSVANLILALGAVLASVVALVGYFGEHTKNEKKNGVWRVLTLIPAIAGVVVFWLTEDWSLPMAFVDTWSLLMLAITAVAIALAVRAAQKTDR